MSATCYTNYPKFCDTFTHFHTSHRHTSSHCKEEQFPIACPARGCRFVYHNGIKALILGSFNRNMMKIETIKSCPNGGKLTSSIFLVARSSGLGCTGIYLIFGQNRQPRILFVWQALLESESFNKPLSDEASTPQRARDPKHTMFKKSLPQHMGSP